MSRAAAVCLALTLLLASSATASDWTHSARVAASEKIWVGMARDEMARGLDRAADAGVNTILTWMLSPLREITDEEIAHLAMLAEEAHAHVPPIRVALYVAPLEAVSLDVDLDRDGVVDPGRTSLYTEHPDWLQLSLDGRPALFYGKAAFWLEKTGEDAWLCPNDPGVRATTIAAVRRIASETDLDAIWWDVPIFQSSFTDDWTDAWPCTCPDCRAEFQSRTGLVTPVAVDRDDAVWRRWVLWRRETMAGFVTAVAEAAREARPSLLVMNEFWSAGDHAVTEQGYRPLLNRASTPATVHEIGMGRKRSKYRREHWLAERALFATYRAVDGPDRASWVLAYSTRKSNQKTLAASVLSAGCRLYETDHEQMDGTVSRSTRGKIFRHVDTYRDLYDTPDENLATVGIVYPSLAIDLVDSAEVHDDHSAFETYHVTLQSLLEAGVPVRVVPDLDLAGTPVLDGLSSLVVAGAGALSDEAVAAIETFESGGGAVALIGSNGSRDGLGTPRATNALGSVTPVFASAFPADPAALIDALGDTHAARLLVPKGRAVARVDGDEDRWVIRAFNLRGLEKGRGKPRKIKNAVLRLRPPAGKTLDRVRAIRWLKAETPVEVRVVGDHVEVEFDLRRLVAVEIHWR